MEVKNYRYIDALRGVAIMMVMATHCQLFGTNNYSPAVKELLNHGTLGVQLFFIISALTLCLSFEKRKQDEKRPILNFYIRRFFRIAPLFYLASIFYYFYFGSQDRLILGVSSPVNWGTILSTLTFTHGLRPEWINVLVPGGWSIATEMGFYVFFPLLFFALKNLKITWLFAVLTAILFQVIYYFLIKLTPLGSSRTGLDYLNYFLPSQLSVFGVGFTVYQLIKTKVSKIKLSASDVIFGQLFLVAVFMQLITKTIFPYQFIFAVLMGVGVYLLSLHPTKLVVNKSTVFIGKISFSLYISHFAVLKLMTTLNLVDFVNLPLLNFSIRYFLLFIISIIISSVTYRLVELPGMEVGKRVVKNLV
ncbi:MAG: acyltransferase [Candidatus Shapirobacteria bacterium]|jgi:peptidoglycan/LPS O-acetylase OafA/YrhL